MGHRYADSKNSIRVIRRGIVFVDKGERKVMFINIKIFNDQNMIEKRVEKLTNIQTLR